MSKNIRRIYLKGCFLDEHSMTVHGRTDGGGRYIIEMTGLSVDDLACAILKLSRELARREEETREEQRWRRDSIKNAVRAIDRAVPEVQP